jgi:hypothetical protein
MNPQFNMNVGPRVVSPQMPISGATMMGGMPDQFMHQQPIPGPFSGQIPDDLLGQPWAHPQDMPMIPTIDTTASSLPGSHVGSPQNEHMLGRSPAVKGLTVLEAPLPASFDSQGISIYAKYGPIAASMPARFENSPPSNSLMNTRPAESSALRNLRTSAYDEARGIGLGSSPNVNPDESISRRIMHSERFSSARPRMLSSSVGTRRSLLDVNKDDDWDQNLMFEEDLVPNSLNDLLTPQERARRSSRTQEDSAGDLFAHRSALSGLGSEAASPKVGSPLGGTSPGRFGPLFTRPQKERSGSDAALGGGLTVGSFPGEAGAFGPVGMGSPLRPSPLNPSGSLSPSMRPVSGSGIGAIGSGGSSSRPTSGDFSVSSPQRKATIGIISQQLQRARLSSRASDTSIDGNVAAAGNGSSGVTASPAIAVPPRLAIGDRTVSVASSVGLGARERIDEEPSGVFSMDQDDDEAEHTETVSAVPSETVRSAKSSQPIVPTPFGTSKWSKVVAGGAPAVKASATTASVGANGKPRENGAGQWADGISIDAFMAALTREFDRLWCVLIRALDSVLEDTATNQLGLFIDSLGNVGCGMGCHQAIRWRHPYLFMGFEYHAHGSCIFRRDWFWYDTWRNIHDIVTTKEIKKSGLNLWLLQAQF